MLSVYALGNAYTNGLSRFGVTPQKQSLIHFNGGVAQIYRPREEFEETLQSIAEFIKSNPVKICDIHNRHEAVNKKIEELVLKELPKPTQAETWLANIAELLKEFYDYYIFNVFLLLALEKTNADVEWLARAEHLRNKNHYFTIEQLLEQYAAANGVPSESACHLSVHELQNISKIQLASNVETWVYFANGVIRHLLPEETKIIAQTLIAKETFVINAINMVNCLKGTVASKGIVRGVCRLVFSKKDCLFIKPHEILVAPMATPEMTVFLGKVSGIITDEGGLSCHAAIITREMNIPCIVGTSIATKVLSDGDEIELDANKGEVKILKKKQNFFS